ncbi:DUF1080 domain-containing protein [Streptomyces pactum]|uniref:DUF1080 domain-containing protein n=1 Tax=Streptomyces pactum TaxID=68249 RepID=A0ABS0NE33_9ACTN|nr:DUF1080 domain-containing protein [Streptomyces pactum]
MALALGLTLAGGLLLERLPDHRRPRTGASWQDGEVHGPWRSVFHGYGRNTGGADRLDLVPRTAREPRRTHAGLVVSTARYGDVEYRARVRTVRQLRTPAPNPWEVAWLVWAYTDPEHFYYLALKPNGWELGKRDPRYRGGQRFLATGTPVFPAGEWARVSVRQQGARITVTVGDRPLVDFTDRERPYTSGNVGAYTEDAHAQFRDLFAVPRSRSSTSG